MKFTVLLETNGRQRSDTTPFQEIEDARNHIRASHSGYSPKPADQALEQMKNNHHYLEVWHNSSNEHQDVVIVSVNSDGEFIDRAS